MDLNKILYKLFKNHLPWLRRIIILDGNLLRRVIANINIKFFPLYNFCHKKQKFQKIESHKCIVILKKTIQTQE